MERDLEHIGMVVANVSQDLAGRFGISSVSDRYMEFQSMSNR